MNNNNAKFGVDAEFQALVERGLELLNLLLAKDRVLANGIGTGAKEVGSVCTRKSIEGLARSLAEAAKSADSVSGSGNLDVLRYGRLLKARQLVGVRGVGTAFDGLYYVKSVTTTLKQGELKQSFQLTRNGLISITPKVPA